MTATVTIDPDSPVPPFEQLRQQLERQLVAGILPAGSQLPTVRQLASDLGLAKNTVVRAYRALEADGLVVGDRRRGTIVVDRGSDDLDRGRLIEEATERYLAELAALGATVDDAVAIIRASSNPASSIRGPAPEPGA